MACTTIMDRYDIAMHAERLRLRGNAAEVGVWRGEFSKHNLQHWKGNYYMIDSWEHRDDGSIDKNMEDAMSWSEVITDATANVLFAGDRAKMVPMRSVDAAKDFPDGFFDWIYIDALHDYESVCNDLRAWWPKLRSGGMFSGDDYGDKTDRWELKYGHYGKVYNWGVVQAVEEFSSVERIKHYVTWMNDKNNIPAWYMYKP